MRSRPKPLSFITVTLLVSLTSALQLPETTLGISTAMVAKSTQDSTVKGDKLSVKSVPKFNEGKFQIAAGEPVVVKKEPSPAEFQQRLDELQTTLISQRNRSSGYLSRSGVTQPSLRSYSLTG